MIEPKFYNKAADLVAKAEEGIVKAASSTALLDGKLEAVAWCLAGKPAATPESNRMVNNPYADGTAERDAWEAGWHQGKALALQLGVVRSDGVVHQFDRPNVPGWLEVMSCDDKYGWHLTDAEGNPTQASDMEYRSDLLALRAGLSAMFASAFEEIELNGTVYRNIFSVSLLENEAWDYVVLSIQPYAPADIISIPGSYQQIKGLIDKCERCGISVKRF